MSSRTFAIFATILVLAAPVRIGAAPGRGGAPEDGTAGWIDAGRKLYFPPGGTGAGRSLPGTFDIFTSPGGVTAVETWRDTVWVGTEGGLYAWALTPDTLLRCRGPAFTGITSIAVVGEGLWVGGDAGLSIRSGGRWRHYTSDRNRFLSRITGISQGERRVWISTWGRGAGFVEDDTLRIFTMADSLLDDRVTCVVEENPHTIWFGTASGVCRADSFSWQSMRYGSRIPVGRVEDMTIDEEGGLFIAVAGAGVALYSHGRVRTFGEADGLPSREVRSLSLDATGTVWAAGLSGVSVWEGSGWTPLRFPGISLRSFDLLSADHDPGGGSVLGSSAGSVLRLSRESLREKRIEDGLPEKTVIDIAGAGGGVWFAGRSAVYRYDGGMTEYPLPGPWFDSMVSGIEVGGASDVWLSTRLGILHYAGGGWEVYDRRNGLPTEHFTGVVSSGGELWFSTFDSGVLRLTGEGWVHYTERHGLPGSGITGLVADRSGAVWVSDGSGAVARFAGGDWDLLDLPSRAAGAGPSDADSSYAEDPAIRFLEGSSSGGAPGSGAVLGLDGSGRCLIVLPDMIFMQTPAGWSSLESPLRSRGLNATSVAGTVSGRIWIGSDDGAFVLEKGGWVHIGPASGLSGRYVNSIFEDASGAVWIATSGGGLTRFTPEPY